MQRGILLLYFLTAFYAGSAQKPNDALSVFIQAKGDSLYKATGVPGIFVGIFNKGEKRFFNFGYAVPEEKMPFDSATVFEAGSITKTLTAYILESVLAERDISDSTPIIGYLPDSVQKNKALLHITFLSLMNHTSGLPRLPDNLSLNDMFPYDAYTNAHLFAYLKNCVLKPDGKSNYSNLGMGLAGVLAQRISGKDYETLLQTLIFLPFETKQTAEKRGRKAQGYFNGQKQAFWNMNALAPAGGLKCSADDMLAYLRRMSVPHKGKEAMIVETLLQPTVALSPNVNVCRAWHTLRQKNGSVIYWHNGGTYGFSTFAAFVRGTEQAVIVVINRFNANDVSDAFGLAVLKKMME